MRILLNKHWRYPISKEFSILGCPSWSARRIGVSLLLLEFSLFGARLLVLNWLKLLNFFIFHLGLLVFFQFLLFGTLLLFFVWVLAFMTLVMSYVAAVLRLSLPDKLLAFAVRAFNFLANTVVAGDLVTRFDSLAVHFAVGAHL